MTPYAHIATNEFSDDSQIGRVKSTDGDSSNYRFFRIEPIKWIVLNYDKFEIKNDKDEVINIPSLNESVRMELLANDILVSGVAPGNTSWTLSTINRYLNNTMINEMFTPIEQGLVKSSVIYNNTNESDSNLDLTGSNANYLGSGSNPTTQKLYVLSRYDVSSTDSPYIENSVFGTENIGDSTKRLVDATDYAKAHYQFVKDTNGKSNFWVRSTDGSKSYYATTVGFIGTDNITVVNYGTRPAMQGGQECPF